MAGAPQAAAVSWQAAAAPLVDLTTLVREHHASVYRYAARLCGCPTEAEDLTQQAFLIAVQKLSQLRDGQRAKAWLLAIVRRAFFKSVRRPRPISASDVELLTSEAVDDDASVNAIDQEDLAAALAELADEFRLVLLMFYFEDLSYQEMAQELQVPIGTVMSRLSRAKTHLRRRLSMATETSTASQHRSAAKRTARKSTAAASIHS